MHQRTTRIAFSVCTAVALAALSACSGLPSIHAGGPSAVTRSLPAGTMSTEALQALDSHGKLPALDWSAELKGEDKDGNGIRDDVDAILSSGTSGPAWPVKLDSAEQRAAAQQLAVAYQKVATLNAADGAAVTAVRKDMTAALECAQARLPITEETMLTSSLEVYTFNTTSRQKAKEKFWSAVGGSLVVKSNEASCG
ncbi:hypothetical protein WJ97_12120 [Burkholderia ubonensis]|uniref:hypothetical protein n=1 Tax=Burkholderia ubonensis TaxID=101571 RepID=UPI0007565F17|nr:hypothetical protein [Burkholderia ubonensis]KVP96623.1 hypothetical protein WJ97_12120 [Burkholderia ubonensis]